MSVSRPVSLETLEGLFSRLGSYNNLMAAKSFSLIGGVKPSFEVRFEHQTLCVGPRIDLIKFSREASDADIALLSEVDPRHDPLIVSATKKIIDKKGKEKKG